MSGAVDVLAVMDELLDFEERHAEAEPRQNHEAREARAAVAELIEAVSDVYGDEVNAGRGTCAPDCMSCRIQTALARVQGGAL